MRLGFVRVWMRGHDSEPSVQVDLPGKDTVNLYVGDQVEIIHKIEGTIEGKFLLRLDREPVPAATDAEMIAKMRAALDNFANFEHPDPSVVMRVLQRILSGEA